MSKLTTLKTKLVFIQTQFLDAPDNIQNQIEQDIERIYGYLQEAIPEPPKEVIKDIYKTGVNYNDWQKRKQ